MYSQELKSLQEIMADPMGKLVYSATGDDAMERSIVIEVDTKSYTDEKYKGMYSDVITFSFSMVNLENQ
jgi:hypothetical protein